MSTRPLRIRVVALGDSLTTGFQSCGLLGEASRSTPYTDVLVDQIRRDFRPSNLLVEVVNRGVVGELTEQMLVRFGSDVVHLAPRIVIILGGSNDLGWGLAPQEIFSNLQRMYELSTRNRIIPVACTVPSILGFDAGIPPRMALKKLLQEYCLKANLRCVDLFSATMDAGTGRLDWKYSGDGLHLNSEGYRKMGITTYEEGLLPLLRPEAKPGR